MKLRDLLRCFIFAMVGTSGFLPKNNGKLFVTLSEFIDNTDQHPLRLKHLAVTVVQNGAFRRLYFYAVNW